MSVLRSFAVTICAGLALVVSSISAGADEIFFCADGSSVTVGSENRAAMQNHPCVRAWFANNAAMRKAAEEDEEPRRGSGTLVRYPVARALALRNPTRRSAYVDWVRTASVNVAAAHERAHKRAHGEAVRSTFRYIRFRRR